MNEINYNQSIKAFNTSIEDDNLILAMELITSRSKAFIEKQSLIIYTPISKTPSIDWSEVNHKINNIAWSSLINIGGILEQSSTAQQQPESGKVMEASLSEQLLKNFIRDTGRICEITRFSKELQKLAQALSFERPSPVRVDELLRINARQETKFSKHNKETFKRKNRGNQYAFAKRSCY